MEPNNQSLENQPIQSQPIQPTTPEPTIKQRGFLLPIIGTLVILLIFAGGAYYFMIIKSLTPSAVQTQTVVSVSQPSPTPADEMGNWKTYSDSTLGYSLKYPNSLKVVIPKLEGNPPLKHVVLTDMNVLPIGIPDESSIFYEKLGGIGGSGGVIIYKGFWLTIETTGKDSPNDVIDNLRQANKNAEQITVNGITGYKSSALDDGGGYKNTTFWVYIANGKKVYSIRAQFLSSNKDYQTLFNQILSTFKFTDQNQAMTNSQNYLYLARSSVFLHNTENVGVQGIEKTGGAPVDIIIPLPSAAVVQTIVNQNRQQKSSVTINGSVFVINVFGNPNEGGCTPPVSCTSTDTVFDSNNIHVDELRILKDVRGVVDINPQTVVVNNYSIPYFTIQKSSPTTFFTDDEVTMWKDLLGKMQTTTPNR